MAVLLAEELDPAPSSNNVQGSTSKSLSCCFDFPDIVAAVLDNETGFLVFELVELETGFVVKGWRGKRAEAGTDGGWQETEQRIEGTNAGIAAWIRHRM